MTYAALDAAMILQSPDWRSAMIIDTKQNTQTCGKRKSDVFNSSAISQFLKRKHPTNTAYHVSALTGISSASIENWLQDRSKPKIEYFLRLAFEYGPEFIKAVTRPKADWLDDAVNAHERRSIDLEIAELEKRRQNIGGA